MATQPQATTTTGTPIVTATPTKLPPWFEPYTRWRMVGLRFPGAQRTFPRPPFPKHITVTESGWVLDEWDRYLLWEAWIDSGRKGIRPVGLWLSPTGRAVSPGWAGRTLKLVHQYRDGNPVLPPAPVPPPEPNYDVSLGFSWVFMAQEPHKIEMYPSYYGALYTADSAYPPPSKTFIDRMRQQGRRQRAWCDCHSTFPDSAKQLSSDLGLDGWCGEGESAGAFTVAMEAGADLIVINLSALTSDQIDKYLRPRKTCAINELYLNQDESRADRENWQNLPIAGRCIAMYDAAGEASTGKRLPFSYYTDRGKFAPHHDSVYDPGATDDDRRAVT